MATELQRRGLLDPFQPVAPLLRSHPEAIVAVHAAYVAAGANVLLAATFRALPQVSPAWAEEIDAAITLATSAAAGRARVFASFGPLEDRAGSWRTGTAAARDAALDGLARAVRRAEAAGVAGVVLETLVDVDGSHAMIACVRSQTRLPLIASWVPRADGALLGGAAPAEVLAEAPTAGADHVGFNCAGPASVEAAVARCGNGEVTWCKPSREGSSDAVIVEALTRLSSRAVVGGCCGVGPEVLARLPPTIRP